VSRLWPLVRPASEHLLGAAMVALAAVPWVAVTGRRVAVVELGAAIVGASLVSIVAARSRRVPPAGEVLLSVAGLAALLLLVVVGDPLGGGEVLRGLRDGVPRVLSTSLPMIDVTWAGVPGATVVWLAAAVVASTVARTRSVAGPVLAVIVTFLAGYAVTLGGRTGDVAATALPEVLFLGLVTGAFALTRSFHGLPDEERGVLALRVTTAVMTLAVALAAGAAAAARGPFVPEEPVRPRLEPVVTELEPEGPLLVTRRLREEEPDRAVATVSVSQDWAGYLPYAVLDRFDGRSWSRADDRLTPTGGVVPVTLPAPPGPEVVVRDLDVTATGGWLPYVGRVASLSGVSVLQAEGEVFRLAEPAASTTYRLRSAQPATTVQDEDLSGDQPTARSSGLVRGLEVAQLATDQRTAGERVCRLLALTAGGEAETASGELGLLGSPCAGRGPDQLAFVRGLAEELAAGRAVEVSTDAGGSTAGPESLADLLELVGPPSTDGRSTGAPEQFAAAYALVADAYGLPVRLVTGFRIEEPAVGAPQELRGEDAWTWAEVAVEGEGWVVVDPTPSAEDVTEQDLLERPEVIDQPDPTPQEAPAELGVEAEQRVVGPPPPPEDRPPAPFVVVVLASAAAAIVLPLLVAVARRRIRRRRRGRGDARQRVVGAWHHLLDTAAELRVPDLESLTSQQLVADLAARAPRGTEGLTDLPATVDRAVFSSAPVGDDEAAGAWATVTSTRRVLRGTVPWRTRVADLWRVPPRSVTTGVRPRRRGGDRRRDGARRRGGGPPREVPTLQGPDRRDADRVRG
jgi:protein-glutamine gamma-glutamyltransferase